jgi:hypothetical protein
MAGMALKFDPRHVSPMCQGTNGCPPALYKAGFQKTGLFEKKLASENCRPCDRP